MRKERLVNTIADANNLLKNGYRISHSVQVGTENALLLVKEDYEEVQIQTTRDTYPTENRRPAALRSPVAGQG